MLWTCWGDKKNCYSKWDGIIIKNRTLCSLSPFVNCSPAHKTANFTINKSLVILQKYYKVNGLVLHVKKDRPKRSTRFDSTLSMNYVIFRTRWTGICSYKRWGHSHKPKKFIHKMSNLHYNCFRPFLCFELLSFRFWLFSWFDFWMISNECNTKCRDFCYRIIYSVYLLACIQLLFNYTCSANTRLIVQHGFLSETTSFVTSFSWL